MFKSVNFFPSSRNVLFQTLTCKCPVICFNAKEFVKTVLQFFGDDSSWRHGKLVTFTLFLLFNSSTVAPVGWEDEGHQLPDHTHTDIFVSASAIGTGAPFPFGAK